MNRPKLKRYAGFISLAMLVLLAGCESVPTDFDYDERVDFRRYQTFSWISANPLSFHTMETHASTLLEQRLMEAARKRFEDKGLRFIEDSTRADLLISFTVGSREQISVSTAGGYYGSDYYGGDGYGYGGSAYWSGNAQSLRVTNEGQVCIDLFDRQAKRPVWHGTSRETVTAPDVAYWRDSVDRIVTLIVAGYPIPPGV